jgi:hypothetical protein
MADRRPIPLRADPCALRAETVGALARAIIVKAHARLENRRDEAGIMRSRFPRRSVGDVDAAGGIVTHDHHHHRVRATDSSMGSTSARSPRSRAMRFVGRRPTSKIATAIVMTDTMTR